MPGVITIEYFAWVREQIGLATETWVLPEGAPTVDTTLDALMQRGAGYASALAVRDRLRFAINQDYALPSHGLKPSDVLAIFPPVTGG